MYKAERALKALSKCNGAVIHAENEMALLNDVCDVLITIGEYLFVWVGYAGHDEKKSVQPVAFKGYEEGYLKIVDLTWSETSERGRGPVGTSIRSGMTQIVRFLDEPSFAPWKEEALKRGYRSLISIPLTQDNNVLGALAIYSGRANAFDRDEESLLKEITDNLAYGIASLRERIRRESAERRLKEREASLAKAQQIAHLGSWVWDIERNVDYGSDEYYRIYGIKQERRPYESFLNSIHPDDREYVKRAIYATLYENKPYSIDFRIVRPDGTVRFIHGEGEASFNREGKPIKMVGIVQDITDRKKAEIALEATKAQAELYLDLMGHDINNTNQIAMGYLELGLDILKTSGKLGVDDVHYLSKPLEALENSTKLISNVRKIQREKVGGYKPELIDIGKMLEELVANNPFIMSRDIKINLISKTCIVKANELLSDVFLNIIGNAIKHSKGPLVINIVVKGLRQDNLSYCHISIDDNGPGIPDDLKKTLLSGACLAKSRVAGKGFGLCLTKILLDDFHGKMWVEDRISGDHTKGARFVIELPAVNQF
jgi:PAS domain S-box-containing protein